MNTIQLQCFLSVADHLNFARAAEELHITQPAVTHQIQSLETELGVKLLKRTTRSVSLTIDGLKFLPDAKEIINHMHLAHARLLHKEELEVTEFSIGCHNTLELLFLPELLKELQRDIPLLHPLIKTMPMRFLGSLLQNETIDVMFNFKEETGKNVPGKYKELYKAPLVCAVVPTHPFAQRTSVTLEDMQPEPLTLLEPPKVIPAVMQIQGQLMQHKMPSSLYFCESSEAALALTDAGLGITLLPDIPPMRSAKLCYIPIKDAPAASYGIYYKTTKDQLLVKKFLQISEAYFKKMSDPMQKAIPFS